MNLSAHHELLGRSCPRCQRRTDRVARRWFERVLSLFMPVARYRCASPACGWEGLLMRRHHQRRHSTHPRGNDRPQRLEPARLHLGARAPRP
jgi:hypothetical protein